MFVEIDFNFLDADDSRFAELAGDQRCDRQAVAGVKATMTATPASSRRMASLKS